jgi:hypothetical protein
MGRQMSEFRFSKLLSVRPAAFGFNQDTAASNRFQTAATDPLRSEEAVLKASQEFDALILRLRQGGVSVAAATDDPLPPRPDAVFPNNWLSFHEDGTLVLYPMLSPLRRLERRESVIDCAKRELGFVERRRIDLSREELAGRYLEGTGSLVLDRHHKVAYTCRSPRTDEGLAREWARLMDYELYLFDAFGPDGTPVYHTNVILWIGRRMAGVGLEWIPENQRRELLERLTLAPPGQPRAILEIRDSALQCFAGNMLEIPLENSLTVLAMSAAAEAALSTVDRTQLQIHYDQIIAAPIPTIEALGGGSVRCMLAEVPFR